MRTEDIEQLLNAGRLPDQELPFHARRLKAALLAAPSFSRIRSSSAGVVSLITAYLMNKKRIAFAGVFVAMFAFVLFSTDKLGMAPAPIAQAQEIVKAAQEQLADAPPETVSKIEAELDIASVDAALREAMAAPDLRKLTLSAEEAEGGGWYVRIEADEDAYSFFDEDAAYQVQPGDPSVEEFDPSITVWLAYTDPKGQPILLGLDERNMLKVRYVTGPQAGSIPDAQ